jgi:N-acetylglucosamine-6-phosphate deacetylase
MIILSDADVVLPDRLVSPASVLLDRDRIVDILPGAVSGGPSDVRFDLHGHYVLPGFIDVHVHGVLGTDSLDGPHAVAAVASALPSFGVTAFCPTSVASSPAVLEQFLRAVREARLGPAKGSARVLPAHLESNFLNPEFRGAQPVECLRLPPRSRLEQQARGKPGEAQEQDTRVPYTGEDLMAVIERGQPDIGIVTVAPELPRGLDLIAALRSRGHVVSLGHSAATYEQGRDAVAAGATQATHLFNRMPRVGHRHPGLAGAMLESDEVAAEIVSDGFHVHPAVVRIAIAAKTPARVMAITDGTAGSGLPVGARVSLGEQEITVGQTASFLEDGTLAGSVLTMDKAFRVLVGQVALSPVDAATVCSTTPARELHLDGLGVLAPGALADVTVLDARCRVVQTWIGGRMVFSNGEARMKNEE